MLVMQTIDLTTERAIRVFRALVPTELKVELAILFGSRARGDHRGGCSSSRRVSLLAVPREQIGVAGDGAWIDVKSTPDNGLARPLLAHYVGGRGRLARASSTERLRIPTPRCRSAGLLLEFSRVPEDNLLQWPEPPCRRLI
jgi:hypothetical protein